MKTALARTAINAIVTLDAEGVFARFDNESFLLPTKKVEVVDSTGAGDNFLGAFLAARMKGLSIHKALALGNIISGKVIQYESARLPPDLHIQGLLKEAISTAEKLTAN